MRCQKPISNFIKIAIFFALAIIFFPSNDANASSGFTYFIYTTDFTTTVTQGSSGTNIVNASMLTPPPELVTFAVSSISKADSTPVLSGINVSFSPLSCVLPFCSSTVTVSVDSTVPVGPYVIGIWSVSTSGSLGLVPFNLDVVAPPVDPPGCLGNTVNTTFNSDTSSVQIGNTVHYAVNLSASAGGCNATGLNVTLTKPALDGTSSGQVVVLDTNKSLKIDGSLNTCYYESAAGLALCPVSSIKKQVSGMDWVANVNSGVMIATAKSDLNCPSGNCLRDSIPGSNISSSRVLSASIAFPSVQFTAPISSGVENVTPANVQVSLSGISTSDVTVNYAVTGGTATGGGVDYTLPGGTVTIPAGSFSTNIPITIINDNLAEPDETIVITLSNPVNATLGANTVHTFTILANDTPSIQFSSLSSSGAENVSPANIQVELSNPSMFDVSINYTIINVGTAVPGVDFTSPAISPATGTITIPAGSLTANIPITILDDGAVGPNKTINLLLAAPVVNAYIGAKVSHVYTIIDFNCGTSTVTDADGNVYNTVQIGTQCWLQKNLNVGALINAPGNQGTSCSSIQKYCYLNNGSNCTSDGGLYQWNQAMCGSATEGSQGICPAGWHIPKDSELYTLENYLATGSCSANRNGWDCAPAGSALPSSGSSGFKALYTGNWGVGGGGSFGAKGQIASFWSSSTEVGIGGYGRFLDTNFPTQTLRFSGDVNNGFSVRCISNTGGFVNTPPSLTVTKPNNDTVTVGSTFNITYNLSDAEDPATVDFYYDNDAVGNNGTLIAGCTNKPKGSGLTCAWDTTGMPPGDYYIYGKADDKVNPPIYAYSGKITINAAGPFNCGTSTVTDADGNVYNTVQIGTQCWMKQNLRTGVKIVGAINQTNNGSIEKYCYSDSDANCATDGGLYQWNEAMGYSSGCNGTGASQPACSTPAQGICPNGWHIPSHYEWTLLERTTGTTPNNYPYDEITTGSFADAGTFLRSGGASGFETIMAGDRFTDGLFYLRGTNGNFWSSTESGANAWYHALGTTTPTEVARLNSGNKALGFSVRCVSNSAGSVFTPVAANVYGFAWSQNVGWFSFNNKNCDTNNDGLSEASLPGCPAVGTFMQGYGVNLNADKTLSGFAWSENIGWVSFNWDVIKDTLPLTECPGGNGAVLCQAKLTGTNFSGWARACSVFSFGCSGALKPVSERGGWDGWIKLRKDASDTPGSPNYGVSLSGEDFTGWAWGADVVGWVSFNSKNCNPLGTGSSGVGGCPLPVGSPIPDYKVYIANAPPTAINLASTQLDYCISPPAPIFSWTFSDPDAGSSQSAYQVQIATDIGFTTIIHDTGKVISSSNSYATPPGVMGYNQSYYWRVIVWDNNGVSATMPVSALLFTTPLHMYPDAKITCSPDLGVSCPASHALLETIQFNNGPTCYDNSNNPTACSSWSWDFGDGTANSSIQNPAHQYNLSGSYTLKFTAGDGLHSCSSTYPININNSVRPKWKEVIPK